jgi:hypothetical protein
MPNYEWPLPQRRYYNLKTSMSLSIFLILSLLWRLEGYLLAYRDVAIAKQVSHTSVPMGRQQELMIEKVCEISDKISRLENLSLSKQVDSLFSQLVITCTNQCHIEMTKLSEGVQEIRSNLVKLCGTAGGILESHFSNLIGSHENPLDLIRLFPYYSNHLKLSQLEFSMLTLNCPQVPKRIPFVGSGPLPLTSIILRLII